MAGVVHRIAAGAFKIDRHAVEPLFVARSAVGVTLALLGGFLTGEPIVAVAAAIGSMCVGFGSLQGVYRTRAGTMLGMSLAMAFATAIAFLVSHSAELSVLAVGVFGFVYGLTASLGTASSAIGVNALIALIVFEHLPEPFSIAARGVFAVFAGGAVQTLLLVVLWPIQRYPQERHALASAYRGLAEYAGASADANLPSTAELRAVRRALADPRPFGRRAAIAAFQTLLDEAERIRAALALLRTANDSGFEGARATVVRALNAIADALDDAHAPEDETLYAALSEIHEAPTLRALYGQLRAAWRSARVPLRGVSVAIGNSPLGRFPDLGETWLTLRMHARTDSPFFRHAVRLCVVLTACAAIGYLFALQRGYWITLTAALVLRPDFTTTFARGFARIGGTLVGVLTATAIVLATPHTPHVYLALAIFFGSIGYAAFQLNYALFSLTITAYVVFLLALLGVPERDAVLNRLFATIAGGVVAMASYALWPTWEAPRIGVRLRELTDADLRYSAMLLRGLAGLDPRDGAQLLALRNSIWNTRANAEESLERMLAEPSAHGEIEPDRALAIMAATQRLGLANTALSSLYLDRGFQPIPELAPLARAYEAPVERIAGLRDAATPIAQMLAGHDGERARAVHAALDLMIDSTNLLAEAFAASG